MGFEVGIPEPCADERELLLRFLQQPFPPRREEFRFTENRTLDQVVEDYRRRGEETAHHAGHADSTRELLDGRRMT